MEKGNRAAKNKLRNASTMCKELKTLKKYAESIGASQQTTKLLQEKTSTLTKTDPFVLIEIDP